MNIVKIVVIAILIIFFLCVAILMGLVLIGSKASRGMIEEYASREDRLYYYISTGRTATLQYVGTEKDFERNTDYITKIEGNKWGNIMIPDLKGNIITYPTVDHFFEEWRLLYEK